MNQSSRFNKIKNAGGIPRRLTALLGWKAAFVYIIGLEVSHPLLGELFEKVLLAVAVSAEERGVRFRLVGRDIKNAGGDSPALDGFPSAETHPFYTTGWVISKALPSELTQIVLFKCAFSREELDICSGLLVPLEFESCEFNSANIIGDLRKMIHLGRSVFEEDCALGKSCFDRGMNGSGYHALPAIVIDFDRVKALKVFQVVRKKACDILFDLSGKALRSGQCPVFFIAKTNVPDWQALAHIRKRNELLLSGVNILPFVVIVPHKEGAEMEGNDVEASVAKQLAVPTDLLANVICLLMQDERNEIVLRYGAGVTGFVDENRKLVHQKRPHSEIKMPGGILPAFGGPSIRGIHLIYTTGRSTDSIIPKCEHMFTIHDANMCSTQDVRPVQPIGKAA